MEERIKKQKTSFFNLHLTSNISIALVLFMVGLITWLLRSTTEFANQTKENMWITIMIDDSISQQNLERLDNYLQTADFVSSTKYISKDSALQDLVSLLGEDPTVLLGTNPVNATYDVKLKQKYANANSIKDEVIPKVKAFQGVTDVICEYDIVKLVDSNINKLMWLLTSTVLVLLFISVVLINNTIRLTIYSKRFIINTMKLVGAKNSFIRAPFIKRSLINAIIGAIIGFLLLMGIIWFIQAQMNGYTNFREMFNPNVMIPVGAVMIVVSMVINLFATMFAVNRYLRMSTDKMYFV